MAKFGRNMPTLLVALVAVGGFVAAAEWNARAQAPA